MAADGWRGAERVFDWSCYSQGTSDLRAASADGFIDAALRWFGDSDPTEGSGCLSVASAKSVVRFRTLHSLPGSRAFLPWRLVSESPRSSRACSP